ncbi:exonuclease SbcCD subunit D [bacterium]|nr:exonuclease SbcCD subunit D [bacterium]
MKFMHLADLHIGKRVNEFSMIDDQKYILSQIISLVKAENLDGVIIAGDIYDKSIPSIEAIEVFENFIEQLVRLNVPAYIVSGNHDSVERLSAFSNLILANKIYISRSYNGHIEPIIHGNVVLWLLPFIRPADVRRFYPDVEIGSYEGAVKKVVEDFDIDESKTNILVAHQFVTANGKKPETSESETCSLGTLDSIDFTVFEKFDYVALGHIHKPQSMGRKEVRYCGSPLKYSFSEVNQNKNISVLDISKSGKIKLELHDIHPLRDMKEIRGNLDELLNMEKSEDYMHITLTDVSVIDAKVKLEAVFPNIMKLDFEQFGSGLSQAKNLKELKEKSLFEHFSDFYEKQTGSEMDKKEEEIVLELLESVLGGEK